MNINFHGLDITQSLKYSVIVAVDQRGFVFVRHQDRTTWEIPGGHIEAGETALEAAKRELFEETGAAEFSLLEVCNYSVTVGDSTTYGGLFFAEIQSYCGLLKFETAEVKSFKSMPSNLTYPAIQPLLLNKVEASIEDLRANQGAKG
jgi:8-oxo-dGTP diphosphatase